MTYKLVFLESSKKEWDNLPNEIQGQFKNKILNILENPCIPKNKLSGLKNCYKIKLRASGYRLVYQVHNDRLVVQIVGIGKRDGLQAYKLAHQRIK
ncbi:MAG: type II toxin-antitoxin system RelE/ParE family toxin [Proteobacteria bacterium]|nr:type II toxin-antitoxin system RelE/ParE family toxin [Pseudomonadota bacterium]